MTAKEWLQRYLNAKKELNRLVQVLAEVRASQSGIRAMEYSDMPRSPSANSDLSAGVIKCEQMEEKIERKRQEQIDILREVTAVIDQIGGADQRTVLTLRYINGFGWSRISAQMGVSRRLVLYTHGSALASVEKILHEFHICT